MVSWWLWGQLLITAGGREGDREEGGREWGKRFKRIEDEKEAGKIGGLLQGNKDCGRRGGECGIGEWVQNK